MAFKLQHPQLLEDKSMDIAVPTPHLHLPPYMADWKLVYPFRPEKKDGSDHFCRIISLSLHVKKDGISDKPNSMQLNIRIFKFVRTAQLILIGINQRNFLRFAELGQDLVHNYFALKYTIHRLLLVNECVVESYEEGKEKYYFRLHGTLKSNKNPMPMNNYSILLSYSLQEDIIKITDIDDITEDHDALIALMRDKCRTLQQQHQLQATAA